MDLFLGLLVHPPAPCVCFGASAMFDVFIYLFNLGSITRFEIGFAVLSALLILHKDCFGYVKSVWEF